MSAFKNRHTGDLVSAFGVVHDSLLARPEYELIEDDRNGLRPIYGDVHIHPHSYDEFRRQMEADRAQAEPAPTDTDGSQPEDSQEPADPAGDDSDNPRSTK